ncbi:hypothetical protein E8E14_011012 [Neopestalotiopsis sp. 37M]|nr:hypothetical protein E8E14_011012 [Neopestalotiopsis sp. 37M]
MSASVFDLNRDEDYDDDSYERAKVNEKTEVVKAWFSSRLSYSYESVLGSGANGVAWLLVEAAQDGSQGRKFVMKRAMEDKDAISQLRNEIKVLRLLAGSQHIVQIIPSLDLEDDAEFRRELTLITEYLPNGTLDRLITRLESRSNYVPNRLLWRVFLCLIKASIALAYPHQSRGNRPEEWPSGTALTLPIVHGDIHAKNVAFGELDAGEHNLVPIAKLIDFGCADTFDLTDEDEQVAEFQIL